MSRQADLNPQYAIVACEALKIKSVVTPVWHGHRCAQAMTDERCNEVSELLVNDVLTPIVEVVRYLRTGLEH